MNDILEYNYNSLKLKKIFVLGVWKRKFLLSKFVDSPCKEGKMDFEVDKKFNIRKVPRVA